MEQRDQESVGASFNVIWESRLRNKDIKQVMAEMPVLKSLNSKAGGFYNTVAVSVILSSKTND